MNYYSCVVLIGMFGSNKLISNVLWLRKLAQKSPSPNTTRIRTGKSRQHGRTQRIRVHHQVSTFFVFVYTHPRLQEMHQQANMSTRNTARNTSASR